MTFATVNLTPSEQWFARLVAQARQDANVAANVADAKVGPQSADDINLIGFGAELAFCRYFNVCPDLDIAPRRGSSDCYRFGQTIDVKTTTRPHGRLIAFRRKREFASDQYVLFIADWPTFHFQGFAPGHQLLDDANLKDLGHGPTYALDQSTLTRKQTP